MPPEESGATPTEPQAGDEQSGSSSSPGATPEPGSKPNGKGKEKGSEEGASKDPAQKLREENAQLRRTAQNKADEAKRLHERLEALRGELGNEQEVESFRQWKANAAKEEEERQRREGEFDRIIATKDTQLKEKDKRIAELEQELGNERNDRTREKIATHLTNAAVATQAHNPDQIVKLYGDQFKFDENGKPVHVEAFDDNGNLLEPKAFLEKLRETAEGANLFRSTLKTGSGAQGGESSEQGAVTITYVGNVLSEQEAARYAQAVKDGKTIITKHEPAGATP